MAKEYTDEECYEAFDKVKINLMLKPDVIFFSTLCFSLKHTFDMSIPTAMTNGIWVKYNNCFFMGLNPDERLFLVLHEVMHCAYLHMIRVDSRIKKRWNRACDHVINLQLIERGFTMPKCGLADKKFIGMSAEQVYDLLPDEEDDTNFDMDDLGDVPIDQVEQDALTEKINEILVNAELASKAGGDKPGTIPGELELFLANLLSPKLPYKKILKKYLVNYCRDDYTFKKPNKRFFPRHYLPSLHSEAAMDLVIGVDISGSVTDEEFHSFVSDTFSILKTLKPKKITLIQFDTEIRNIDVITGASDLFKLKFVGRGGTAIGPIIEWVNINKPKLIMLYTDGVFKFKGATTKMNTLWLIHNNPMFTAPFGKVIHYKV